jgi:hypothetical protein
MQQQYSGPATAYILEIFQGYPALFLVLHQEPLKLMEQMVQIRQAIYNALMDQLG